MGAHRWGGDVPTRRLFLFKHSDRDENERTTTDRYQQLLPTKRKPLFDVNVVLLLNILSTNTSTFHTPSRTMTLFLALSLLLCSTSTLTSVAAFQTTTRTTTSPSIGSSSGGRYAAATVQRNALSVDPVASLEETFAKSPAQGGNNKDNKNEDGSNNSKLDMTGIALSGLQGQALEWTDDDFPSALELRSVIPKDCFEVDTKTSLGYLSVSVVATALCTAVGVSLLNVLPPSNWITAPFWFLYSGITGTVAMGLWVLAHECGHGAFSKDKRIQDTVGYVLHSLFLVPYYSWQRSHAVHHKYTNHMELGETHVPEPVVSDNADKKTVEGSLGLRTSLVNKMGIPLGMKAWGALQAFLHLIIGWPAYLMIGATGGSDRGMTNHYWPDPLTEPKQPKMELFPGSWKEKVFKSDVGVAAVATGAVVWAICNGLPQMMALYGGPLIVVNAWLVIYTW